MRAEPNCATLRAFHALQSRRTVADPFPPMSLAVPPQVRLSAPDYINALFDWVEAQVRFFSLHGNPCSVHLEVK